MNFDLQPLVATDAPRCVDIYFAAFQNTHSHGCWPRTPAVRAWWEKMILDEINEPGANWLKAVSKKDGRLAAFAKWIAPKPGVEPSIDLPEWPEGADVKLCNETFGDWAKKHREFMGVRGHWYLEIIATDPEYQGQGAASQILRWGIERADRDHVEAYLESSPEGMLLYQRYGFAQIARTDTFIDNERVKGQWYPEVFMLRSITENAKGR